MVFIRSAFLLVAGSALFASPASAQTTINYLSGTNDSASYSTTPPDGPLTLSVATGTATQSGALAGTGSVINVGVGTLSLTGSNSYEGGTVLNEGTLRIGDSNALGTGLVTINGGTLGNAEGGSFGTENLFTATADFGLDVQGAGRILDFFSNVEMGTSRTVTFTGDGIGCFEGGVSGHNITFLNGGEDATVTFCSDVSNTFTGTLRIGDGIHLELWKIGNDFDPPVIAISGDLLVDQGATAILITPEQFAVTSNLELNGTLRGESTGTNTVQMLSGTGTVEGVSGDTLAISSGSFAGTITNTQAIIKQGVGTLTMSGSNSYTDGTSVLSGTLRVANDHALGDGNVTVTNDGVIYVDTGIALDVGATHSVTLATNGAASYQKEFADAESLANFGAIIRRRQ